MKQNFRIKLDGDSRAVSYRNIEVTSSSNGIVVTQKGVRTMIRQYLKSVEKKIYQYPISFKYYKKSKWLDIKINGITGDEISELLPKFDQFTEGNAFRDVSTNYLISFDLRSLALWNVTPNAKPTTTPAPTPASAPQSSGGLPKATKIKIVWHEGTGEFDDTIFTSWSDLQNALKKIYDNWSSNPIGYDKVKVEIEWENGKKILDRIDVGDDFKPYQTFIGEYLQEQDSAMYESNFDKRPSPNDRDSVSWTDEETPNETPQQPQQPEQQPQTPPQQQPNMRNNYILTKPELVKIYGSDWKVEVDWVDEFDFLFNHRMSDQEQETYKSGSNISITIDDVDYDIKIEATTLACYHDYDNLSAEEIQEIIDGLEIYLNLNVGNETERQEARKLMELLIVFKKHNK
jgi:hypothetical protein